MPPRQGVDITSSAARPVLPPVLFGRVGSTLVARRRQTYVSVPYLDAVQKPRVRVCASRRQGRACCPVNKRITSPCLSKCVGRPPCFSADLVWTGHLQGARRASRIDRCGTSSRELTRKKKTLRGSAGAASYPPPTGRYLP